jgi:hypothetical protein
MELSSFRLDTKEAYPELNKMLAGGKSLEHKPLKNTAEPKVLYRRNIGTR